MLLYNISRSCRNLRIQCIVCISFWVLPFLFLLCKFVLKQITYILPIICLYHTYPRYDFTFIHEEHNKIRWILVGPSLNKPANSIPYTSVAVELLRKKKPTHGVGIRKILMARSRQTGACGEWGVIVANVPHRFQKYNEACVFLISLNTPLSIPHYFLLYVRDCWPSNHKQILCSC